jgi:multicomponent K+:H+ antiporter subunit C
MELLLALGIGTLTASGTYLLLCRRSFDAILGFTLLSYAVNLFIFASGRVASGKPPIVRDGVAGTLANYADPLPQALVLTAIVISFAMTAVLLALAIRARAHLGTDALDAAGDGGIGGGRSAS